MTTSTNIAPLSTFVFASTTARRVIMADCARAAAIDGRRAAAIMHHSTQMWLDTYATDVVTQSTPVLADNYLKIARSFARREMAAIDSMHADLRRAELS